MRTYNSKKERNTMEDKKTNNGRGKKLHGNWVRSQSKMGMDPGAHEE
jgi:hypothetical protein